MKRIAIYLSLITLILSGCSNYLDQYPYGNYTDEQNWNNQQFVQGLVGQCYDYMTKDYNNNEGYYLDGATDDAVISYLGITTSISKRYCYGVFVYIQTNKSDRL